MDAPKENPSNAVEVMQSITEASQRLVKEFLKKFNPDQTAESNALLKSLTTGVLHDSGKVMELHQRYALQQSQLWTHALRRAAGQEIEPLVAPEKGDRRFSAPEWKEIPYFDYLRQAYLLNGRWLTELADAANLEPHKKKKLKFFTRQLVDALSPSNFPATNPEALKLAMETKGESLARGLKNIADDVEKGRISMVDESAFEVGRNLAVTPGSVVFQNELFQLIQYRPTTATVREIPLLIVPPFINKYYILDLQPDNSFVKYAVDQGFSTFLVSWRNIPANLPELGKLTWDDYAEGGVLKALATVLDISRSDKVNTLGFCVGGTLLATTLAALAAQGDQRVNSVTLLTTMLDFSDVGEISVYVDEAYVSSRERELADGGVVRGSELASTFASLRANELVWFYVVNNYLKGKSPEAFDLLYWNSDGSNLPGKLYAWYVRNMYLENNLRIADRLTVLDTPVSLRNIKLPTFTLAAREDHIVPWHSAYASARLLGGDDVEFVLAASGHIAGVINPASKNRRNYWAGSGELPTGHEEWLAAAEQVPGSWWPRWSRWLGDRSGREKAAPKQLGNRSHGELEPAPGAYVKARH
jgi:polyhydroxyalkanoate synthase